MKKKLFILGTLIFVFTFLYFPQTGTTLGTAQAQMKPAGTVNSTILGTVATFQCIISSVASLELDSNTIPVEPRILVSCAPSGGLSSFASAIGTTATTAGNANRYLVLLNTAVALGKTVTVFYDINSANNPLGCQPDCRKITGLVLGP